MEGTKSKRKKANKKNGGTNKPKQERKKQNREGNTDKGLSFTRG